jgi:acyl-coenzyme A synthetase/AMP-(fatty) acid ligase
MRQDWGFTSKKAPMHELSVLAAAHEAPGRDCLIADDRVWSYADVAARVRIALGSLRAQEIETGDRVALTPGADVDSICWLYALFELGCPAVLLHPRLTDRERAVILGEAQPRHVITTEIPEDTVDNNRSIPGPTSVDQTLVIAYTSGSRGGPRHRIGGRPRGKPRVASRGSLAAVHAARPRRWAVDCHSVPHREELYRVELRNLRSS